MALPLRGRPVLHGDHRTRPPTNAPHSLTDPAAGSGPACGPTRHRRGPQSAPDPAPADRSAHVAAGRLLDQVHDQAPRRHRRRHAHHGRRPWCGPTRHRRGPQWGSIRAGSVDCLGCRRSVVLGGPRHLVDPLGRRRCAGWPPAASRYRCECRTGGPGGIVAAFSTTYSTVTMPWCARLTGEGQPVER